MANTGLNATYSESTFEKEPYLILLAWFFKKNYDGVITLSMLAGHVLSANEVQSRCAIIVIILFMYLTLWSPQHVQFGAYFTEGQFV